MELADELENFLLEGRETQTALRALRNVARDHVLRAAREDGGLDVEVVHRMREEWDDIAPEVRERLINRL